MEMEVRVAAVTVERGSDILLFFGDYDDSKFGNGFC